MYEGADPDADADADRTQEKALRSTRVELEPIGVTEHGQRYRVMYAGEVLAEGRRNPVFDACRALLARCITGRLEAWRRGKTSADMQLDIERGARLAVWESEKHSLRTMAWRPRFPVAVSSRDVQPPGGRLRPAQWWTLANENGRR